MDRPAGLDEVVRALVQRAPRSRFASRAVVMVPDGSADAAGFGLAVIARMACADRRVRRRFGRRMWWVTAGPGVVDGAGKKAGGDPEP